MSQAGLDRFTLATIVGMNRDLGARFACALVCFIIRAVIDYENMIELTTRPLHNIRDMSLLTISGNDRGDGSSIAGGLHS